MYADGDGIKQDDAQAIKWFLKAAAQNDVEAEYNLGVMFRDGEGVAKNGPQAVYWFERAAAHRYADAAYNLAMMYRDGDGIAADAAKATEWFRKAKHLGYDGDTDEQQEVPPGEQTIPI